LCFEIYSKNGTNKSGALNLLSGTEQEIKEILAKSDDGDHNEEKHHPQLLIDHFTFIVQFDIKKFKQDPCTVQ